MFGPIIGPLNTVDVLLIVYLVLAVPFLQLRRSHLPLRNRPLQQRVVRTFLLFGAPLALIAVDWIATQREASALGFDMPIAPRGEFGLGIAALAILSLIAGSYFWPAGGDRVKDARALARLSDSGMLVSTPGEFWTFVPLAFLVGCGTEVLFRGFLWCVLSPEIGAAGAVIVAALAYGIAHGVRSWPQAAGAVASAFVFTIAYVLTRSLWWLMILHTAIAFFGAWTGYRLARMHSDDLVPGNP